MQNLSNIYDIMPKLYKYMIEVISIYDILRLQKVMTVFCWKVEEKLSDKSKNAF